MPCAYCNTSFSIIKWKNRCQVCMRHVCANCLTQKKCLPCYHVLASHMQYETLMKLKVKDLKLYSSARSLPINSCMEKHELVEVILQHSVAGPSKRGHVDPDRSDGSEDRSGLRQCQLESIGNHHVVESSNDTPMEEPSANASEIAEGGTISSDGHLESSAHPVVPIDRPVPSGKGNKLLISDITSAGQISALTSREMKQILTDNFVDYKGCVEKSELRSRVKNLYSDRERNEKRAREDEAEDTTCRICWDRTIDCVLLECGHMVTCTGCGKRLNECPMCRRFVVRCVHVFRS